MSAGRERGARILIDADGCPRDARASAQRAGEQFGVEVLSVANSHHLFEGAGHSVSDDRPDGADFAIANEVGPGDLVITQDYGLAALVLARGAAALHPSGAPYLADTIDAMLTQRHLSGRLRRQGVHMKGPRKRTAADRARFEAALLELMKGASL